MIIWENILKLLTTSNDQKLFTWKMSILMMIKWSSSTATSVMCTSIKGITQKQLNIMRKVWKYRRKSMGKRTLKMFQPWTIWLSCIGRKTNTRNPLSTMKDVCALQKSRKESNQLSMLTSLTISGLYINVKTIFKRQFHATSKVLKSNIKFLVLTPSIAPLLTTT